MRKFLIACAAAASILGAGVASFLVAAPLSMLSPTSGCGEASQLLNCINSAVYGVLNGAGQTRPISIGTFGTVADNAANTVTLNTQGGVATFTGLTVAQNGATGNLAMNNSLVTASSACVATMTADSGSAAGSAPYIERVQPGAGTLNFLVRNAAINTSTGAFNLSIAFWCAN